MNRIKLSPLANLPINPNHLKLNPQHPKPFNRSSARHPYRDRQDHAGSFNRTLFVPLNYEKNYRYPLIVWLHNNGDDARQLQRVMPGISLQNFVGVAPQAALGDTHCGFYWEQDSISIDYAADGVLDAVDYARARTNVAGEKIFIAGYGAAGTMAFRVALAYPDIFAGVGSIHGPLPQGSTPLRRWSSSRNLDVFWCHYRNCNEFSQDDLCRQLTLLHIAGFSVTLRQYPTAEELTPQVLGDFNRWIMQFYNTTIA